ncbi:MAG TPA: ribosome biogenesis GTP-binding protein YihA/YsxC, partial [Myxococcaceae bacterium]|nr:ribosome biogenesis GTP-binding protein YihA/YsxC [Myxococcaceae bacterium]
MIRVLDAGFLVTAVEEAGWPAADLPEVAFVGRSNVGKSSMINALTGRRKLVRVSNTPGRTRTLNFFDVVLERGEARRTVRLADLPGYGFAKVSKTERLGWDRMITGYLQ